MWRMLVRGILAWMDAHAVTRFFLSLVARMAGCRWRSGVWGKDGMEGSVIDVEADVLAFAENTMR